MKLFRAVAVPVGVVVLALGVGCAGQYPAGQVIGGSGGGGGSGEGGGGGEAGGAGRGGSGGGGLEPFEPTPVPLEEACETWALARCRAQVRCQEIPARFVDDCVELTVERDCFGRFEADVVDGWVRYDGAAWGRCLKALSDEAHCSAALYQDFFLRADEDCRAAFVGTVADGEPCRTSDWCASGLCDLHSQQCPSRCMPTARIDEECSWMRPCTYPLACQDGRCRELGGLGEWCNWGYAAYPGGCRPGLFCEEGGCVAPRQEGEECEINGVPCDTGHACLGGSCFRLPGPGEPCDNAEREPCRHDLRCDRDRGVCVEASGPGEPCIAGLAPFRNGCVQIFQCIEESFRKGTCGRGPGIGEACVVNDHLRCEGAQCQNGICMGTAIPGHRCDGDHLCLQSLCHEGFCVPSECVPDR